MKVHFLKITDEFYCDVENEIKTFEIRLNDREYYKDDLLIMYPISIDEDEEIIENSKVLLREVTYVSGFEQKDNYVVLGIKPVETTMPVNLYLKN